MRNEAFSKKALELIAVADRIAGYDRKEIVTRCLRRTNKQCNVSLVCTVLDEMLAEQGKSVETIT